VLRAGSIFSDPELPFIPKQMTRERLKPGFRELLNRVYDVEAFSTVSSTEPPLRPSVNPASTVMRRLLVSTAWTVRAVMLAFVMARQGELLRHLRVVPRVLQRNAARGPDALGFCES
jgi:hypothetical protein